MYKFMLVTAAQRSHIIVAKQSIVYLKYAERGRFGEKKN